MNTVATFIVIAGTLIGLLVGRRIGTLLEIK